MDSSKTEDNIKFAPNHKSIYKIGLFGDSNVGKTSFIRKYLTGKVPSYPMSTLTMEFAIKLNQIDRGGYIKTQIWDTPGREQYREMTFHHINNFSGGIIFYDISKRATFENVLLWIKILKERSEKNCIICFENNKDGDKCIALPCMHIFHADCIKTWLNEKGICPTCKHEIKYDYYDVENANF